VQQVFTVVVAILLARNLGSSAYGLIAIVSAYIGLVTNLSTIGFGVAIIQNQFAEDEEISTLYWLNLFIVLLCWIFIVFSSDAVSIFYNMPELKWLIIFGSIEVIIGPFYRIHEKLLEKDLKFHMLAIINISSSLTGGVSAVIAVYNGIGVYSLLVLTLVNGLSRMAMILFISNWKPSLCLSVTKVKSMVAYAFKHKIFTTLSYFERNIDTLLIGKLFDVVSLGLYSFAYTILYMPVKRVSNIFVQILFPAFSLIQNDNKKMLSVYLQSIRLISIITFPIMVILSLNAALIIPAVFGQKWMPAVDMVQVLTIVGAIQSVNQLSSLMYHAVSEMKEPIYFGLLKVILIVAAIFIGSSFDVFTAVLLILAATIASFVFNHLMISKRFSLSISELMKHLSGPILSSLIIVITYYLVYAYTANGIYSGLLSSIFGLLFIMLFEIDVLKGVAKQVSLKVLNK